MTTFDDPQDQMLFDAQQRIKQLEELQTHITTALLAITIYAEGVKEDFPEAAIWMDNILSLANIKPDNPDDN